MRRPLVPGLAAGLVATLLWTTAACGADETSSPGEEVDAESRVCRAQWRELADEVGERSGREQTPTPSQLRSRWTTVEASVEYYATSATGGDCGSTLEDERATVAALTDFSASLRRFDMERRLAGYERADAVTSYARPSGREGRAAPSRRQVRTALEDLRRLAPQATGEQSAAWQQAAATDLADRKARRRAVADLGVVSGESDAYRRAAAAVRVIDRAAATAD